MPAERLALALERLTSGDWLQFERFAAEFLAPEYPSLRTMASPHGDRGRDGQMYLADQEPRTVVQYSVAQDWRSKIRDTVRRITEELISVRTLIYLTNQVIGPAADDLISGIRRDKHISLDIRDRHWFVEREHTHPQRSIASAELAKRYVDPLLVERGVRSFAAPALDDGQARVALVHLALEREDEATAKGWTKSCFEALVLSALHDTCTGPRMQRGQTIERVRSLLPAGDRLQITQQIEGALTRLCRRGGPVKEHGREHTFALAFNECEQLRTRLASFALQDESLKDELTSAVRIAVPRLRLADDEWATVADDLRYGLEVVLLKRGEAFAQAVTTGQIQQATAREVFAAVIEAGRRTASHLTDDEATTVIMEVLERPSIQLRSHLRRLADAYTMYAFLRQTPDVQKAVMSIFNGGELWLDTSVILPLLAETLLEEPAERRYTTIFRAALSAGLKLYVTGGVIEELDSHLNLSLACARTETKIWRTRVPFVFAAFMQCGRSRRDFVGWLEHFRGRSHPLEDIAEYLADVHAIDRRDIKAEANQAPSDLRVAVEEVWYAIHEQRRKSDSEVDTSTMQKLVAHDVENCLGVIQLRHATTTSPLGYHQWYLTLDKTAFTLMKQVSGQLGHVGPDSPALSPDFMVQYLRLATVRTSVERELWVNLPLLTDVSRFEYMPKDLIDQADELRHEMADLDERIIRRRVRDRLDNMKLELGPAALAGIRGMEEQLMRQITTGALPSSETPHIKRTR